MTQPSSRVLVVDDEEDIRTLIGMALKRMGHVPVTAESVAEARARLAENSIDLCLTDMRLPDGSGFDVIAHIQHTAPRIPVAVITAYSNTQDAIDSLKAGAFDFVSKPLQAEQLSRLVDAALTLARRDAAVRGWEEELIGDSAVMQQLRDMTARMARSQAPLHIFGESGTGKERVARLVHASSARADGPFVPVNCGAIPSELMESELFGHVRGAFTGASRDKPGLFQMAEGGTLFLDEVAELPSHMQVKLLRALQERVVRPVGGEQEVGVNVRVISATNVQLAERVAAGRFRQDLYYRLNVISLRTPALREHPEDIPALARHILRRIAERNDMSAAPELRPDALQRLQRHHFPGNVRELENILERAVTLTDGGEIAAADLHLETMVVTHADGAGSSAPAEVPTTQASPPMAAEEWGQQAAEDDGATLEEQVQAMEKRAIEEALRATRWNRTRAAERLGLSFRQLRYKIKKLGIE